MVVTASADGVWLIKSCSQPSARPSAFDALIDGVKVPDFPGSHIGAPTGLYSRLHRSRRYQGVEIIRDETHLMRNWIGSTRENPSAGTCAGGAGRGAARCNIAKASSSNNEEPELLTTRETRMLP